MRPESRMPVILQPADSGKEALHLLLLAMVVMW